MDVNNSSIVVTMLEKFGRSSGDSIQQGVIIVKYLIK